MDGYSSAEPPAPVVTPHTDRAAPSKPAAGAGLPLLEVEDLHVAYGGIRALRGISFTVPAGSVVSLIGANGAGKTTTLLALSGIVPTRAGRVRFAGADVTNTPSHRLVARGIVQVPEGRQVLARMSVRENLEMGGYVRRDRTAARADLDAMLERFPALRQRLHLPAGSLSGGEQQMLAIARALMARPRLLLLDEPSMGLAPLLVNQVFEILAQIHAEGTTILLVEQNARRTLALSDYAYVLETGRIVMQGTGSELMQNEAITAAYLGAAPVAGAGMASVPPPGADSNPM